VPRQLNFEVARHPEPAPIAHTISPHAPQQLPHHPREVAEPTLALKLHRTSYSHGGGADPSEPGGISAIYKDLIANEDRLHQIYDDVMAAYEQNSRILLLTTWKTHLDWIRCSLRHPFPSRAGWSNTLAELSDHTLGKRWRPFTTTMTSPLRCWQLH
jgi:hypothetical protein